jgi:hypothetical protein
LVFVEVIGSGHGRPALWMITWEFWRMKSVTHSGLVAWTLPVPVLQGKPPRAWEASAETLLPLSHWQK